MKRKKKTDCIPTLLIPPIAKRVADADDFSGAFQRPASTLLLFNEGSETNY